MHHVILSTEGQYADLAKVRENMQTVSAFHVLLGVGVHRVVARRMISIPFVLWSDQWIAVLYSQVGFSSPLCTDLAF